jgi:hypothetical protein
MSLKTTLALAGLAAAFVAPTPGGSSDRLPPPAVEIAGVTWLPSLEEAKSKAAAEGKPILHFQLLGRLDDEFC